MKLKFNPIVDNTLAYFPKKYTNQAIGFYMLSLLACSMVYRSRIMPLYIMVMGIVSIILFFQGSFSLGRKWEHWSEKKFLKQILQYGIIIRLVYVIFIYFFNLYQYGTYYESNSGDIGFYVEEALESVINHPGPFATIPLWRSGDVNIADMGYIVYLGCVFKVMRLVGVLPNSALPDAIAAHALPYVLVPLLLKCVYGTYTCIFMYKIAKRHFGDNVARMTAIFCILQWNMIWWCGSMMKETEMIFIATWFVERMDRTILGLEIKPTYIAATVAIGFLIFTFRSALFMTAIAATMLAIVMTQSKKLTTGKKVFAGVMIAVAMAVAVGDNIVEEIGDTVETIKDRDYQKRNMDWRAERSDGSNQFAKYAGAAVFAPLIFTIPFPNMVYTNMDQEMLMQVNGGNFEKNVLSFFVIFAMFQLLLSGQWRQHVFPIAYYVGYLVALVMSVFAQSGRFHMPIMPFAMMFGAYGLTLVTSKKHKIWFTEALVVEIFFCLFWGWFKLKGRGMI